jgi:hypothetical protein
MSSESSLQAFQTKVCTHFSSTHAHITLLQLIILIVLNKQSQTADKEWSSSLGLGGGLRSPHRKKPACNEVQAYLFLTSHCRVTPNTLSVLWRDINVFSPTPLSCATSA